MTVIRKILKDKKESVSELYKIIGGNRAYFFAVCAGTARASAPMRKKIYAALGVPAAELFDERGMAKFEQ